MGALARNGRATTGGGAASETLLALMPWLVAAAVYAVVLIVGSSLLNDPDSYWHVLVGKWIVANGFPRTDPFSFTVTGEPWIAKEWLSQIALAAAHTAGGWTGVVVLSAVAFALAFGLLAASLRRELAPLPTLVFLAAAFMLAAPHALARPHIVALPVAVAWVAGLTASVDREAPPPWWLLPLMILWANLHGSVTLGLVLAAAVGLDAVASARRGRRQRTALLWIAFVALAAVAACITPYGAEPLLVAVRILSFGPALSIIGEWQAVDFRSIGPFEVILLGAIGFALWRGISLPPIRILIVLGLLHLALSAVRNGEMFALLAPLFVAAPLARQLPGAAAADTADDRPAIARHAAALVGVMLSVTLILAWHSNYRPSVRVTPEDAVSALRAADRDHVLNDYDFGGYLIEAGVPTFIDGRTELYGSRFLMRYHRAVTLADLPDLMALLDRYRIGATLLKPTTPAVAFLDTLTDWTRIHSDGIAVVHVREPR